MRSDVRAHVWGLHALLSEAAHTRRLDDSPTKKERARAMIAFFFAKAPSRPLPAKEHGLGETFEGQVVGLIYRVLESPTYREQVATARERMKAAMASKDEEQILAESEFVEFAMHAYENGFRAGKALRLQFLEGSFGARR